MYGTVARMKVKPGMMAKLMEVTGAEDMMGIPGLVSTTVFRMDADANELFLIVAFQDKETYTKNADSPEQNKRYEQFIALLEGAPEWHDGEVVYHHAS